MRFNLKCVKYNDTITISVFDDLVGFDEGYARPPNNSSKEKKNIVIEPFTNTEATVIESEEDIFYNKQDSLQKSVQRSKRNVLRIIRSMNLENALFVTLTFDNAKVNRNDFTKCCAKTRVWLQNQRKNEDADNMSFLCVPELHSDLSSWHMHCILCDFGDLPLVDSGHKDKTGKIIYNIDSWNYGFSTAIKIQTDSMTSIKLAKYVTKYFTKESAMIAHNRHRYFSSQNIPKPIVRTWSYESEQEKEAIINSIYDEGFQPISKSYYDGFVGINYIEAIKKGNM